METIYLLIVLFLGLLAISDLIVGVANDAANFLNSAIGSRIAPIKIILTVASLGVLTGATFSSGMMEIARSGVFHPQMFFFRDVMIIFVAVMIADILLLDLFNTFGLPTSTTISLVFDLLGAAVAVSIFKINQANENIGELGKYINTEKALAIIGGILISVVIAFIVGSIVQCFTRFLFTFNQKRTYKYFGAIFGGLAITSIVYFMIMKGAKGASFMKKEYLDFIEANTAMLVLYNIIGWTIFLQLVTMLFRVNIFKVVILAGTFALAFAFAGNDLVNFIGVPLAGLSSFKLFKSSSDGPGSLTMESLSDPVHSDIGFLLLAGVIMAGTLWLSKKAHKVIQTSLKLSEQSSDEKQQFESTALSRAVVRIAIAIGQSVSRLIPLHIKKVVSRRFERFEEPRRSDDEPRPSFDQVRASVNLVTASILIASATSLKLPLSTTYVTFMVAMGTSLADGAWNRETAVYKVSGVMTVIGGWFITAISAFLLSFTIALLISAVGLWVMLVLGAIVLIVLFRENIFGSKAEEEVEEDSSIIASLDTSNITNKKIFEVCTESVLSLLLTTSKITYLTILAFSAEKRKKLKKLMAEGEELKEYTKEQRSAIYSSILTLDESSVESGRYCVLILDSMREMSNCVAFTTRPVYEHVDNNHSPLMESQAEDLSGFNEEMASYINQAVHIIKNVRYDEQTSDFIRQRESLLSMLEKMQKRQLKLIKQNDVPTRTSMLYLNLLSEYKTMVLLVSGIIKTMNKFAQEAGVHK